MRVLVIEDNANHALLIRRRLTDAGMDVEVVQSAEAALRLVPVERFSGVLCDIVLPAMNGLEFARAARNMRSFKEVVLIAMSSSAMGPDEQKALDAGFKAFFPKPFTPEIAQKIKALL